MLQEVVIIGAGLAGSEAAWQLAERGISVRLVEMRPSKMSKAHRTSSCAELVCSNSLRGAALTNAVGLLKEELRRMGSLILEAAHANQVPAGGALAVDRERFSSYIDSKIRNHPRINFQISEQIGIPAYSVSAPVLIATGPLTADGLARNIEALTGAKRLAFFDAISPVVLNESLDHSKLFRQSRYDKGGGDDYLNVPLDKEAYERFVSAVAAGEKFGAHEEVEADMVADLRPFEGCMPIEEMVARGPDTLRFGPMKPVGLRDPRTGKRPHAIIQLRQDDKDGHRWNIVGFQTRLKHPEQQRIFRTLPGLESAEFVRLGSVHRNTFLDSPNCLDRTMQLRGHPGLFFGGQVTGVEGYVESTAAGMVAALNVARSCRGMDLLPFPEDTATGALVGYITDPERKDFQPMNISYGIMKSYFEIPCEKKSGKDQRRIKCAERALDSLAKFMDLSGFWTGPLGRLSA
ncbi:MAG: methylenetetrahydrofolate--tRNA-(uracil(54)-C(5))-methyltransferase (FADH(2)-oxidizing) TrmFO [Oligoflexia bacterium]|nr:methylenetetrahydrofolate--tRNA-(uracil(54)-C(5))-methyltransferase (FADH(2)-oxidizing) TrmFO [Oligoflexia bacterium]